MASATIRPITEDEYRRTLSKHWAYQYIVNGYVYAAVFLGNDAEFGEHTRKIHATPGFVKMRTIGSAYAAW